MTEKRYLIKTVGVDNKNREILSYYGKDSIKIGCYGAGAISNRIDFKVDDIVVKLKGYKRISDAMRNKIYKKVALDDVSIIEVTLKDGKTFFIDTVKIRG